MNSYEVVKEIDKLAEKFNDKSHFLFALNLISESTRIQVDKLMVTITMTGNSLNDHNNAIRTELSQVIQNLKKINIKDLFVEIDDIEKTLENYDALLYGNDKKPMWRLKEIIAQFSSEYHAFLQNYTLDAAMRMILTARILLASIIIFRQTLLSIRNNIEKPLEVYEKEGVIDIYLPSEFEFAEFTHKLYALNEIYAELCALLNISLNEHPARIAKIESGTLWAKIFGESRVIKLITDFIASTVTYFYRNYTREGKIVSIPKKVEIIESVLGLSKKLKEEGIDISEMDENIVKASNAIAKNLNLLLSGEPRIEINKTPYSIGKALEEKYIEDSKKLLIENRRTANNEEDDETVNKP